MSRYSIVDLLSLRVLLLALVGGGAVFGSVPEAVAQTPERCAAERTEAERWYLEGRFDRTVAILRSCLDREEVAADEAEQVYRLLALAYMNDGDPEQAEQAIRTLLSRVPAYQADPVQDPPTYSALVAIIREEVTVAETPVPEAAPEAQADQPVSIDQRQPEEEESPPAVTRPQEPVVTPPVVVQRRPSGLRRRFRTPKSWLLATGGAVVLATALAITLGGRGSDSSPAPPR